MNKFKTIILLYQIMDDAITKLVENINVTQETIDTQNYRMNRSQSIIDELYKGVMSKKYKVIYKIEYSQFDIINKLSHFQERLFTSDEIKREKLSLYEINKKALKNNLRAF